MDDIFVRFFRQRETLIAPGVFAVVNDEPDALVVIWLRAERRGSGAVAAWLDQLPTSHTVRFIAVTDDRLAEMLERRHFKECFVLSPSGDVWSPAYVRPRRQDHPGKTD